MLSERMELQQLVNLCAERLKSAGVESYRLDSEVIIAHVLEIERFRLLTEKSRILSGDEISRIEILLQRREKREPLAYILQKKEFYSLNFFVDENVLIPRPETELLVDMVIYEAGDKADVLDLCTGSGAIAIACKKNRKDLNMTASDISQKALDVAQKNCLAISGIENISFVLSDVFENISGKFDVIVSNPPYISFDRKNELEPELNYEPDNALFALEDGNKIISSIIENAPNFLKKNGILLIEIGKDNADFVKSRGQKDFSCSILNDYAGLDRIAILKLNTDS